jgi:sulfur relay (sulfurtransferase) DsrC/TusE family protein
VGRVEPPDVEALRAHHALGRRERLQGRDLESKINAAAERRQMTIGLVTKPPTDRQFRVLQFLRDYIAKNQYAPSYREIIAGLKMNSTNAVDDHLRRLERRGLIERLQKDTGRARALAVTERGHALLEGRPMPEPEPSEADIMRRRIEVLEAQVASIQMALPRGVGALDSTSDQPETK